MVHILGQSAVGEASPRSTHILEVYVLPSVRAPKFTLASGAA